MKLNIDPAWLQEMAEAETGHCISVGGGAAMEFIKGQLIGKTLDEAKALGYVVRATMIDSFPQWITFDHDPNRINVSTTDGKISSVGNMG